jgi:hypothetical protein
MAGQKTRTKKTSQGVHGAGGKLTVPLTGVQKVLLSGGALVNISNSRTKSARKMLAAKGHGEVVTEERPRRTVKEQLDARRK